MKKEASSPPFMHLREVDLVAEILGVVPFRGEVVDADVVVRIERDDFVVNRARLGDDRLVGRGLLRDHRMVEHPSGQDQYQQQTRAAIASSGNLRSGLYSTGGHHGAPVYSARRARIGSIAVARRAGR